ncbi:hypothetical protein EVJ32_04640 [Exiguobacterium sp. SH5S4]|uniref:hypothetical protein n=1 Tax=Exiguobacterium sp. SH5S4 TaxID=2510961 RepID=UPI00103F55B8|nr:hypothetical protein [Exiguobacterium sp. SH5S4]TCI26665.1 hypothetical protein EVJ32_04640 [Exiguobacterium sp. SH5S4]
MMNVQRVLESEGLKVANYKFSYEDYINGSDKEKIYDVETVDGKYYLIGIARNEIHTCYER